MRRVFLVRELESGWPDRARWGTKTYDVARLQQLSDYYYLLKVSI
jgi:hypothetical protein